MKRIKAERKDDEGFWLIHCPRLNREIPIYRCAGSFMRESPICAHVNIVRIGRNDAGVGCLYPETREEGTQ